MDRDYYDVIIMNYANADMVGHTGVLSAATAAIQVLDECIGRVVERVLAKQGLVLITADHGNAEKMVDSEHQAPFTAHTTSQVPFILADEAHQGGRLREGGSLRDIAPTLLSLMGIAIPAEMTGRASDPANKLDFAVGQGRRQVDEYHCRCICTRSSGFPR